MSEPEGFEQVVQRFFPYDGPHSGESVTAAAAGLVELLRYLNNASRAGQGALQLAPDIYEVLSSVRTAVEYLDQFFRQLGERVLDAVDNPTLYDDRPDQPAVSTAQSVVAGLMEARARVPAVVGALRAAAEAAAHLGHDFGSAE